VYEGASQQEEAVLQRVFSKMRTKYGDVYADEAQTRRKFDRSLDVFKGGHERNLETINSHPGIEEEWDKIAFIFNAEGVVLAQPWHVDASTNIASSFCLWTSGLPTNLLPYATDYSFEVALTFMGIRPKHWEAAKMFAKDHRDQESALCLEDIAQDMAPLLADDFDRCVGMSDTNGKRVEAGWVGTTRGPWGHSGPGTPDGKFRLCLLLTSFPRVRGQRGYNTEVQHHCSQVCLYFWCFVEAVHWLWKDRVESSDADAHWRDHHTTSAVIRGFLSAARGWEVLQLDVQTLWARALAHAYKADHKGTPWMEWVPAELRQEPSKQERKRIDEMCRKAAAR
jgi:hypothetical protein